jgi:hypothetical protein
MDAVLMLLALIGFAVVASRLIRSGFRAVRWGIDSFWAREKARTRARRGDVTGMTEAQRQHQAARRGGWRALGEVAMWAALLIAPPLTVWARPLYASYGAAAIVVWGVRAAARRGAAG